MVVVDVVRDYEATPWMSLPYARGARRGKAALFIAHFIHNAAQCVLND